MGWLSKIFSGDDVAKPIDAVGNAIDKIFTSDDEKLSRAETMERLNNSLPELTAALDKLNATSSVPFVSMARPACVWIAGLNFMQLGVAVIWVGKTTIPQWYIDASVTGFLGALGLYGLSRTVEKLAGKIK